MCFRASHDSDSVQGKGKGGGKLFSVRHTSIHTSQGLNSVAGKGAQSLGAALKVGSLVSILSEGTVKSAPWSETGWRWRLLRFQNRFQLIFWSPSFRMPC